MAGRGQPPKHPEDRRRDTNILLSPNERREIEKAVQKTGGKFVPFVRNAALEKAREINRK